MPDLYEVRIRGPIGPLIQACLPGFTTIATVDSTVLAGTALGPDHLHQLLEFLTRNGMTARDVRLKTRDDPTTTSDGDS
jgi:hypothetical protein